MRFAHTGDCHLGGWKHPELRELNMDCFRHAVQIFLKESLDFILIAGDLFDTAYPDIETVREAFREFKKLKDANIMVFFIAGSHDFSVSGKSFLDVLESAGFGKNAFQPEERGTVIYLKPLIYRNVAIYGYPGKKSGLEVEEIARIKLHDSPGLFRILMLHTAIRDAVGTLPIQAVDQDKLPSVDYTALAHLHVNYNKKARVYCGPLFPNNSAELEELKGGSFYLVDTSGKIERREIVLKEVLVCSYEITNALVAKTQILKNMAEQDLRDKIVILKLSGAIETGKIIDIDFREIESFARKQGAYAFLRLTSKLYNRELQNIEDIKTEEIELNLIENFKKENKKYSEMIDPLINMLQLIKKEEEKNTHFEERLLDEVEKVVKV